MRILGFLPPTAYHCPNCEHLAVFWSSIAECYICGSWLMLDDSAKEGKVTVLKEA